LILENPAMPWGREKGEGGGTGIMSSNCGMVGAAGSLV